FSIAGLRTPIGADDERVAEFLFDPRRVVGRCQEPPKRRIQPRHDSLGGTSQRAPDEVVAIAGITPDDVVAPGDVAPHDVVATVATARVAPNDVVAAVAERLDRAPAHAELPGVGLRRNDPVGETLVAPDDLAAPDWLGRHQVAAL